MQNFAHNNFLTNNNLGAAGPKTDAQALPAASKVPLKAAL